MTIPRVSAPRRRIAVTAVALAFSAPAFSQSVTGSTLPTGGQVVGGQASISQSGAAMSVQQTSAHAAIDWQSFSIGSQASVTFSQPSASAIALNRVVGANGSEILGRLSANGQVFLVNPNGILFGRGAQVDVGGLLASTLDMSSGDFMAGRYTLRGGNNSVVNQGDIRSAPKGYVALVGSSVANDGTIDSPAGTVSLVAGSAATLDFMADGLVKLRIDEGALRAEVSNGGFIHAQDGSVFLSARSVDSLARSVVNNTGVIEAHSVKILGDVVVLSGAARIDASAEGGGGEVLIGGNYQGKGPEQNAARTYVGPEVTIAADAIGSGDGGRVIVWGDEATYFHGAISARGGAESGHGGFVETSGATLRVTGTVDASAPRGNAGTWLLDPKFITIATLGGVAYLDGINNLFGNLEDQTTIITPASLNTSLTDVVLQANTDITFAEPLSIAAGGVGLTAQAGRSILVNADISTTNGDVTLIANDSTATPGQRDPGAGGITMASGIAINAGTGTATLRVDPSAAAGDVVAANITADDVFIVSAGGISHAATGVITANRFLADGGGDVFLPNFNMVGTVAGRSSNGRFYFNNGQDLVVGSITGPSGTINGISAGNGAIEMDVIGALTLNQPLTTGDVNNPGGPARAFVHLEAGSIVGGAAITTGNAAGDTPETGITLTASSGAIAVGPLATGAAIGSIDATTDILLDAAGDVTTGSLTTGAATATTDVAFSMIDLSSGGTITTGAIQSGNASSGAAAAAVSAAILDAAQSVSVGGGISTGSATGNSVESSILISAGTGNVDTRALVTGAKNGNSFADRSPAVQIAAPAGSVTVDGAIDVLASDSGNVSTALDADARGGSATVQIFAGGSITTTGLISAIGGSAATATSSSGNAFAQGGSATLTLNSDAGTIFIGGPVVLTGGNGGTANAAGVGTALADGGTVFLEAYGSGVSGGPVTLNAGAGLQGGNGGAAASGSGTASANGGDVDSFIGSTAGAVVVNGGYLGIGGTGGSASSSGANFADGGFAGAVISTPGQITIGAAGTTVIGGDGGTGSRRGGDADTILEHDPSGPGGGGPGFAAGDIILNGNISVTSGDGALARDASVLINGASVTANGVSISTTVGSGAGIHPANIEILGGAGGINWTGGSIIANGGGDDANIELTSAGSASISNALLSVTGTNADIGVSGAAGVSVSGSSFTGNAADLTTALFLYSSAGDVTVDGSTFTANGFSPGTVGTDSDTTNITFLALGDVTVSTTSVTTNGGGGVGGAHFLAGTELTVPGGPFDHVLTFIGGGSVVLGAGTAVSTDGTNVSVVNTPGGVRMWGDDVTLQPGSSVTANGVNNASVSIDAALNATLRGTIDVTATAPAPAGIAAALVNAGGNVILGADISVLGAGTTDQAAVPAGVRLVAGGQIISEGGVLTAVRTGPGGETYVDMTAQTGIGTPLDPVRIFDPDAVPPTGPIVLAQNLGATGDIAISFNLAGGELVIGGPFSDFRNNAPDGSYFLRMEQGNITLTAPFQPDVPLFGNQGVVFETPTGDINLLSGAAIQTAGSGGITLTAGDASHTGNINVIADTAPVVVQSGGLMTVSATGTLTLQGGSGAGWSASLASAGGQIITAGGDITIIGGDGAGGGNSAQIYNVGTAGQEVAADGFITIAGGAVGGGNSAKIQTENGEQRITAEGISLTGGADGGGSGTGNFALISSGGTLTTTPGNQVIDVGAAGLLLQGGGGALTDNFAIINQPGPAGTSQTITVSAGGQILLLGGSSAQSDVGSPHGSYAVIQSTGSAQLIDFTAGGALSLTGGTVGTRNFAIVAATTGDQTITGSPTITLVGGASGGTNAENNGAQIQANAGTQTIVAGATALTAGAGGMSNHATLSAPTQLITVHGNLALTGGNSSPGTTGAGARIGGLGGASPTPTVLTLIVDGNVDLVGGGVAGASGSAIGSASLATPQPTTIDMQVGGNLTLTAGAVSGVRIGSPIANIAGGDILVDVGGDVTLDDNGVIRGAVIATTGNLDLSAGAFMGQTALSRIEVNTLDANAGTGISLNGDNLVAVFNASNSGGSGGVQLVNGGPLNIAGITNGGTGNVVVINDGPITISGPIVDAPAGVLLQSTGAITETGAGSITTGGTLTVQGDGGIVLEGANSVLAFSADNATGGNVSFVNTSPTLTVAAVTQTGSGTVSVAHTGGMLVAGVDGGAGPVSLTATGNMLIAGDVQTTDAGASAIILSAGHGTTAGTATGGDLLIGANVIVGPGGRATLFTGSIAGSTFGSLVPSGSGNFRYNSSPTTTNYTAPLGSGIYAIYREQPTLTITAGSPTAITYGTPPGAFSFTVDGFENGDTAAQALSTPPTIADDGVVSTSGNLTVGTHAVTASGAVDQLGYAIGYVAGTLTVDPLTVTASGITANNKVYDATTAATLNTGSLSGLITNDVVTVSATGTFIDRHAGIGKTVNISGASLSGTDAGNYVLSSTTGTTTADITPRPLTVTAQADSKVYDQTTVSAVVPQITLGALQGADTATFVQTFDTKNVGTGKTLTASGAVSDGNGGNNYALTFAAANTGVITAKPISAAGIVANSKVYDQTATATLNFSGATVAGGASNAGDNLYYTGDVVALDATSATGAFADKNAGTAKPIAIAGLALTGTDAGNYTLNPAVVSANITPKAITATGITAASRTYDATASASVNTTGAAITGGASGATDNRFYTGDTVTLDASGAVGVFADKNVGTAKPVTVTGLALSGADAGNYLVSDASGATADITAAGITSVTGIIANDKIHDGTTDATLNTSATVFNGRLASDVLTVASAVASFQDPDIGTDKPVDISAITLGGADAGNYVLLSTTASAIADILPVPPAPAPVAPGFEPSTVIASTMSEGATGPSEPAASNVDLSISVLPVDMAPLASRPALDPAGAQFAPKTWQLLSDLWELRRKKRLAIEEAVRILERNPNAADLPSCGAQASGECIAEPSGQRANVRAQPTPKLAHFPEIIRKVALLIGVSDYQGAIPKLDSPLKDVAEVGKLYGERFGYEVRMLGNADKTAIVRELNRLILESGPNDSVTVFYAGHGHVVEKTGRGYWIPAKASADDPTQWISNQDIGKFLANIPAKQILLVSDSCYSGTLTRDAKVAKAEVASEASAVLERRSVTVLSSGGEEPVADSGKDGHSVFAWHLMRNLRDVGSWSKGVDVHEQVAEKVRQDFPQQPQYGAATGSGHEAGGDFLFEVRRY